MNNQTQIVRKLLGKFSAQISQKVTRKCIVGLQALTDTLSGNDSQLTNVWDEICVQVQFQHSFYWDTYENIARDFVSSSIKTLTSHEKEAIWLQTEAGWEWLYNEDSTGDDIPAIEDEIIDYILNKHLLNEAGSWSNQRIRKYLDNATDL